MPHLGGAPDPAVFDHVVGLIAPLGWHLCLHLDGAQLPGLLPRLRALPLPFVIDHMGRVRAADGLDAPAFRALLGLADLPGAWVKVSGLDRIGAGRRPFAEGIPFVRALVEAMPERTLWGTDWPHPNVRGDMPDDGELCDAFFLACPDDEARRQVLVHNPARLYGFPDPSAARPAGPRGDDLFDSKGDKHVEETILRRPAGAGRHRRGARGGARAADHRLPAGRSGGPGGPRAGRAVGQGTQAAGDRGEQGRRQRQYRRVLRGQGAWRRLSAVPDQRRRRVHQPGAVQDLPYDPARDFAPVSRVVNNATVFVVNPANLAVDAADFVKRSQADSQPVAVGSSGIGSIPHLTLEMFADASRAKVMHVPYKGAAPVINDVMGNQVAGFFGDVPGLIGHIQGGKLKALGIAAPSRHPLLPDVKTLAEQGIAGVESNNWYGLVAPAATPAATVDKLNQAVRAALGSEAVRARLEKFGAQAAPSSPQELAALIASDRDKWTALIQRKNIRPEGAPWTHAE